MTDDNTRRSMAEFIFYILDGKTGEMSKDLRKEYEAKADVILSWLYDDFAELEKAAAFARGYRMGWSDCEQNLERWEDEGGNPA